VDNIDLQIDPAPDLAIEVDITRSSLQRFPIFAAIGISEVWRYDGERVRFYALDGGIYREVESSAVLPPLTSAQATRFLDQSPNQAAPDWEEAVRDWVRARI